MLHPAWLVAFVGEVVVMEFEQLMLSDKNRIIEMSRMATENVREHFDPIIGKAQNDYMIEKFQTEEAISEQLEHGYQYYFTQKQWVQKLLRHRRQ